MKNYDRLVLWLDYLDSERKRSEGRRVPLNSCTRSPTLDELTNACKRLNLDPEPQPARFPAGSNRLTGYVSVKKTSTKQKTVMLVARELSTLRGERPAARELSTLRGERPAAPRKV
jgi:signal recognition particle subunit SEC65